MYRRLLVAIVALFALAGCGGSTTATSSTQPYSESLAAEPAGGNAGAAVAPQEAAVAAAEGGESTTDTSSNTTAPSNAAQFGRMVIRTAQISLLVENTDATEVKVRNLVQTMGGYVLTSQTSGDEESRNVALTFKVPAERFDDSAPAWQPSPRGCRIAA